MWRLSTSAAKVTAAPVAPDWSQAVDWIAEPLALFSWGNFALLLPGKGDIEIEM